MAKRAKTVLDFELSGGLSCMREAVKKRMFGYFTRSFIYTADKASAVAKRNTARFVREMRERREIRELNNNR